MRQSSSTWRFVAFFEKNGDCVFASVVTSREWKYHIKSRADAPRLYKEANLSVRSSIASTLRESSSEALKRRRRPSSMHGNQLRT